MPDAKPKNRSPYRWPRRAGVALLIAVAGVLALRWYVISRGERAVAAFVEQRKAAGLPVTMEQIIPASLAATENAATDYLAAIAADNAAVDSPSTSNNTFSTYPPAMDDAWFKLARASRAAHGPLFAALRAARSKPQANWNRLTTSPQSVINIGLFSPLRIIAVKASDEAMLRHLDGDDAAALELCRDLLHLGDAMRQTPANIDLLIALGIDAMALADLQTMAPALRVDPSARGAARRPQVVALINELLEDERRHAQALAAARAEVVFGLTYVDPAAAETFVTRPLFRSADARTVERLALVERVMDTRTLDEAFAVVGVTPEELNSYSGGLGRFWGAGVAPADEDRLAKIRFSRDFNGDDDKTWIIRMKSAHLRDTMQRRAAATALALRLHVLDHGRLPATLAELVPAYLPAVPTNVLVNGVTPLELIFVPKGLPDGSPRPVLRFAEDAASTRATDAPPPEPVYSWHLNYSRPIEERNGPIRQWRDVTRWTPSP